MGKAFLYSLCVCILLNLVCGQYGFFPQRTDRRISSPFGLAQNLFAGPNGLRNTLTNILQLRPENSASNPAYIYPFQNRPINKNEFGQNRPIYNNQFDQNRPIYNNQFDQNQQNYNNQFDQNRPISNNGFENQPINNNQYDEQLNNNQFDQNGQIGKNEFQLTPQYEINQVKKPVKFPSDGQVSGNDNFINQQSTANPFVDPNPQYVERPKDTRNELTNANEESLVTNAPEGNEEADETDISSRPTFAPISNENNENVGLEGTENGGADENRHGIPNVPPPGFTLTTLPPLTPVPLSASRNNFNVGAFGVFSNNFL